MDDEAMNWPTPHRLDVHALLQLIGAE